MKKRSRRGSTGTKLRKLMRIFLFAYMAKRMARTYLKMRLSGDLVARKKR